jgi:hypothetical protein
LIRSYLLADDLGAAIKVAENMELDPEIEPIPPMYTPGFFARIELSLAQGDPEKALEISQRMNRIIEDSGVKGFQSEGLMLEAQSLLALDPPRPARAQPLLEKACQISEKVGHKRIAWKAYVALAELSEEQKAAELRQKAWEIVEGMAAGIKDPELLQLFLGQPLVRSLMPVETERDIN